MHGIQCVFKKFVIMYDSIYLIKYLVNSNSNISCFVFTPVEKIVLSKTQR